MNAERTGPGDGSTDGGAADQGTERLRYRLLTGADDRRFCARVSQAIDDGYVLYGSPSITVGPEGPVVCQAVVLP